VSTTYEGDIHTIVFCGVTGDKLTVKLSREVASELLRELAGDFDYELCSGYCHEFCGSSE
jgi:hypothetical protein